MKSASQLAHAHVGWPAVEGCSTHDVEPCAVCGGHSTRGKPVWEFIGSSLTDQTSFCSPHSDHVCEACVYVRARFSPVVGREPKPCDRCNGTGIEPSQAQARKGNRGHREPGQPCAKCDGTCRKESAGRWSNFSHLYDGHTLDNATKEEKPKILAFLRRMATSSPLEPCTWFAAISDTGQKHVLPYTPINMRRGSGRVRFEESEVFIPPASSRLWSLVGDMTELLTAGATKEELQRGAYTSHAYQRCRERIEHFERDWRYARALAWFALCLWLAQRDEETVAARMIEEKGKRSESKRATRRQGTHRSG